MALAFAALLYTSGNNLALANYAMSAWMSGQDV